MSDSEQTARMQTTKTYVENHVRFVDDDGQPIVVLCTKGEGQDVLSTLRTQLNRAYTSEPRPKNLGYALLTVFGALLEGHLVRPEIGDSTVENVFVVAEVPSGNDTPAAPWITAYDNVAGEFFFEAYS